MRLSRATLAGLMVVCAAQAQQTARPASSGDEAGSPLIRSYTPRVYKASPQNWAVTQDRRGLLYFANNECVLEYDGVGWRRIPLSGNVAVRSVATDGTLVYAGGQGEFGYLEADAHGSMAYRSLVPLIPEDARKFRDVWTIVPTAQGVYFGTYQGLYRWVPGEKQVRVWKPRVRFGRMVSGEGTVWAVSQGEGLQRMGMKGLEPVPGGETLLANELRSIFDRGRGLELATVKGLFRLREGQLSAQTGEAAELLGGSSVYAATVLRGGGLAVATLLGGVFVVGRDGRLERQLNKDRGLLDNGTNNIFEDREGGVWVTSSAGLDRADLAMTRFARGEGLHGAAYAVVRHEGRIYAGTDQGLFVLGTGSDGLAAFEAVKGAKGLVSAVAETRHGLLAVFPEGVYQVEGATAKLAAGARAPFDVSVSARDPNVVYVAGQNVVSLRWNGKKWGLEKSFAGANEDFRSVLEGPDGVVWVATQRDIFRIDWRTKDGLVTRFGAKAGVPAGFKNVYRVRDEVVFATPKGLLSFDAGTKRFEPWMGAGREFADGSRPVSIVREAPDGRLWITGDGYHGELARTRGGWAWKPMTLGRAEVAELYTVMPEGDGTVWAAGTDGFLARFTPQALPPTATFAVMVRRVQTQGGPVAFDGAGEVREARIGYKNNSLRFEFVAPWLNEQGRVEYQVRLEGVDTTWSEWSQETRKDYTHLWEGDYRFRVRARNGQGAVSQEAAFGFAVQPPWFRTWPAYAFYLVALAGSVWGLLTWRVAKLEAEKAELEQIVEERTIEIREQRDQIQVEQEKSETLLLNILPASVAEELKSSGTVQPQHYDDVTVGFTDFAGFTLSAETLQAGKLVSALHEYFTVFDEIVEEFGLEKLKTIGDAYMLVSGLPKPRAAHALDAVLAALRMVEAVAELAERGEGPVWQVRVGLHSGPVAAGVVGVRKFAFDIWGNTVNLASRMESSGVPGRVNLSESTWAEVREFVDCTERGQVTTKDKRDLRMYFAVGLRAEFAEPRAFAQRYRERFGVAPVYEIRPAKKVVI